MKRFQTERQLPVTGKFDELTLGALGIKGTADPNANVVLSDAVNMLVETVDLESQRPVFLAATNTGLFRSFDPTQGWQRLSYGAGVDNRTMAISVDVNQPETIWVGTAASGVLVSRDGGTTWQRMSGVPSDVPINVIARSSQRPGTVYVGTKQAFFMTRDNGANWSRRGGNLPYGDFTSILVNPRNGDEVFVGNAYQTGEIGGGVYRTVDGGTTWARIDPKERRVPSQRIWALALDPHNQNTLFVGSHSAGVYVVPRGLDGVAATSR